MKRIFIMILITVPASLLVFSCAAEIVKSNERDRGDLQEREDFFVFFQGFCTDSSFQLSRIKFPLIDTYLSSNLNRRITRKVQSSDWKFMQIKEFTSNTFEYYFASFNDRKLPDTDEMVYAIIGIENGIQVNYYFKRENGKWFLVKMEDLST